MVKIPEDAEAIYKKQATLSLATASKDGKPNSSYVRFWWFQDGKVVLINNFMNKARKNMEETGWASVSAYDMDIHKAYQIKGTVEFKTEGPEYERGKMMAKKIFEERGMQLPAKEAIILTPVEIYYLQPGPDAGKAVA
jgi:predicted pyridoxine 5'-phosphate oxidase superfamily flavin-nucleotide-binding protein